jgi:branched-chain amino acid transport system ATP-binding protein
MEPLLQTKNLSVHYGGVKAVNNVSVSIDEGEIVALMGPNGAGKSTILKAIFGLAPIASGSVLWHEQPMRPIPHEVVRRGISYVPQGRRVFAHLTVEENLEIGGYIERNRAELRRRLTEVFEMFPALKAKRKMKSGTLSGGQQQMLAIGRGLMTAPTVLLLDEPTLGLAPKVVKEVFQKIQEINRRHRTAILLVEHNLKSVLQIVERAYLLDKGAIVAEGPPKELLSGDLFERVFLGK